MKKVFTLFTMMFAVSFFANAQNVKIILEAHDVWGDQSGYQFLMDANGTTFGTVIPATGPLTSGGNVPESIYNQFIYKIPANADGAINTTHVVFNGKDSVMVPPGTYDYCITNPSLPTAQFPNGIVWIANGPQARSNDFVVETDWIYHFTVALLGEGDNVSLHRIYTGTSPMVFCPTDPLQFTTVVGNFEEASVEVQAWNLTGSISVTAPAQFQISIDGFTYATTATIPANGGTLYIKYIPAAEGNHTGSVTLSATGITSINIPVMGASVNCATISLPYVEDFTTITADCWSVIDANEDGNTFIVVEGGAIYEYSTNNGANDWLVSPKLTIPAEASFNFQAACYMAEYPEKFSVYVMNDINNYANATRVLGPVTLNIAQWQDFYVNLTPFAGQQIYVGIKCESDADMFAFMVKSIEFNNYVGIENQTQDVISVYPNPANSVVNVTAPSTIKMVEVFNMTGQSILSNQVGDTQAQISTSNLSNGTYFVRITTTNDVITRKISIVK